MTVANFIENKKRVKLKSRQAEDPGTVLWDVFWDGALIGHVSRMGEYGRDTYPWDWWLAEGVEAKGAVSGAHVEDTRRSAIVRVVLAATGETVWY